MITKLIGIEKTNINGADYEIRYYRNTGLKGSPSFSSEVNIGPSDKVILDDRSMARLKYKVDLVLPASIYNRRKPISGNR